MSLDGTTVDEIDVNILADGWGVRSGVSPLWLMRGRKEFVDFVSEYLEKTKHEKLHGVRSTSPGQEVTNDIIREVVSAQIGRAYVQTGFDQRLDERFRVTSLCVGTATVQKQRPRTPGQNWCDEEVGAEEMQVSDLCRENLFECKGKPPKKLLKRPHVVWGATVYQANRIRKELEPFKDTDMDIEHGYFDVLVVDEASQMPLANVLPPLSLVRTQPRADAPEASAQDRDAQATRTGRLVVAGDPKQMGTILQCEYPTDAHLIDDSPPPHLSLLAWLKQNAPDACVQLEENHRMTAHLATFTRECLGYENYFECVKRGCACNQPCGVPLLQLTRTPSTVVASTDQTFSAIQPLVAAALRPDRTFVLIVILVKWQDYGARFNTWEGRSNLPRELTDEYDAREGRISATGGATRITKRARDTTGGFILERAMRWSSIAPSSSVSSTRA